MEARIVTGQYQLEGVYNKTLNSRLCQVNNFTSEMAVFASVNENTARRNYLDVQMDLFDIEQQRTDVLWLASITSTKQSNKTCFKICACA